MPLKPITRKEQFYSRIAGDGGKKLTPITRTEHFLARIAGDADAQVLEPINRTEYFLQQIINSGGGGEITVEALTANENKVYTAPSGKAYSPVTVNVPQPSGTKQINISQNGIATENVKDYESAEISVNVPNSYAAGDEGKVVSNGALVAQTPHAQVTQNGTIDTTLNNSVEVAVPGPSGTKQISITQNGTTTENVSGYASAEISVSVSGGQTLSKLSSGTYTLAADGSSMNIPITYSGTAKYILIEASTPVQDTAQSVAWQIALDVPEGNYTYGPTLACVQSRTASNTQVTSPGFSKPTVSASTVTVAQQSSNYPIKANDYKWEIWGYAS